MLRIFARGLWSNVFRGPLWSNVVRGPWSAVRGPRSNVVRGPTWSTVQHGPRSVVQRGPLSNKANSVPHSVHNFMRPPIASVPNSDNFALTVKCRGTKGLGIDPPHNLHLHNVSLSVMHELARQPSIKTK